MSTNKQNLKPLSDEQLAEATGGAVVAVEDNTYHNYSICYDCQTKEICEAWQCVWVYVEGGGDYCSYKSR